jgi:cytochrome c-type biogenesis protein CcmH/NrfG
MRKALIITALTTLAVLAALISGCEREADKPIPTTGGFAPQSLEVEKEVKFLRNVLQNDPQNLQAWIKLGNVTMDAQRYNEAIEAYGRALEIDPNNVNVRVDRGVCFRRIGRSDQAVEHFKKGIEIDPTHLTAHRNMGIVLAFDLNKYGEAADYFEKYIELAPTAPDRAQTESIIKELRAATQAHPEGAPTP